jgi:hypothetical protein
MNENNKQNKKAAVKWVVLIALSFGVALCSMIGAVFYHIYSFLPWTVLGCIIAIALCIVRLQMLGFGNTGQQRIRRHARPYIPTDTSPGIAGKTYVLGDKMRWPYY